MNLGVAVAALMTAATPTSVHEVTVDHAGTAFRLVYAPRIEARAKTVGHAIGTRTSTERCRWTIAVQVERRIHSGDSGEPLAKLLPETRDWQGEMPGNCRQHADTIAAAQAMRDEAIRRHVAAVASADRPAAVAEIDAARALALN